MQRYAENRCRHLQRTEIEQAFQKAARVCDAGKHCCTPQHNTTCLHLAQIRLHFLWLQLRLHAPPLCHVAHSPDAHCNSCLRGEQMGKCNSPYRKPGIILLPLLETVTGWCLPPPVYVLLPGRSTVRVLDSVRNTVLRSHATAASAYGPQCQDRPRRHSHCSSRSGVMQGHHHW